MATIADNWTEQLLQDAHISAGMRVLDVGCGHGKVTSVLSRLVGDDGSVVGLDIDSDTLLIAAENHKQQGLKNLTYMNCPINELANSETFDFIFGRRVFMYLPDPQASIAKLASHLLPGGVIAVQEHDASAPALSGKPMPLHHKYRDFIWETVRRESGDTQIGLKLWSYFTNSGMKVEGLKVESVFQTPTSPYPFADIVVAIKDRIVAQEVASEEDLDLKNIHKVLDEERNKANTTFVSENSFCIWGRKL